MKLKTTFKKFKIALSNKDKQLFGLGKLLKAAKSEYQIVVKENKRLREFIIANKKRRR